MTIEQKPKGGLGFVIAAWILTGIGALLMVGGMYIGNDNPMPLGAFQSIRGSINNIIELMLINVFTEVGLTFGLIAWLGKRRMLGAYVSFVALLVIIINSIFLFIPSG